jgi:hypothetical protein
MNFAVLMNAARPNTLNFSFVILVFKTARVARLVPSTRVVAISNRINAYWYLRHLTPSFYWKEWREHRERVRRMRDDREARSFSSNLGGRQSSWPTDLDIAALAAVKTMADEEKEKMERTWNLRYQMLEFGTSALRYIRVLPKNNVELKRHIAATKIQRAWRSRLARPGENRSDDDMQGGSVDGSFALSRDSGAAQSIIKKRSMLSRNAHTTKTAGRLPDQSVRESNARVPETQFPADRSDHRHSTRGKRSPYDHSQVGTAMAEVTGQRVVVFILLSLLFVFLFTYYEKNSTRPSTMVVLHGQTTRTEQSLARRAVDIARQSVIPK